MKKITLGLIAGVASLFTVNSYAELVVYSLDPNHSYVEWHIDHFGFSNPSGKWWAEGILQIDKAKLADSKVDVTIKVNKFVTGIPALDEHLSTADFFDVAKYPDARFVSDKVDAVGTDKATIHGMLTLKGITKPVVLAVKLNKEGVNPITDKSTLGFTATTDIKRSDFGMSTLAPGLSDDVKLNIEVEASRVDVPSMQPMKNTPKVVAAKPSGPQV